MGVSMQIEQLPWLEASWRHLKGYLDNERIPHGLLICGPKGVGKGPLARAFAQRLLCVASGQKACGQCASCKLFLAATHPDFLLVAPSEPGKALTVDGIRSLIGKLNLKGQYSKYRVVLVEPADAMNVSAANCLLKSLEEPGENTILILVTNQPSGLPPTIVSRCQQLAVAVPGKLEAKRFLALKGIESGAAETLLNLANGAPLQALSLAEEDVLKRRLAFFADWIGLTNELATPVMVAEKWSSSPLEEVSIWLGSWIEDLIRLAMSAQDSAVRNFDLISELKPQVRRLNLLETYRYLDQLNAVRGGAGTQLNKQLLLEQWLIHWVRICQSQA